MTQQKKHHGGRRPGAGRPKNEATKVIRAPESLIPTMKAMIHFHKQQLTAYRPAPAPISLKLPQFSSRVKAGFPSPADDYIEAWLDLNEHLIKHKEATFFVQASGDSMTGAGIQEGSILIVDRAIEASNGDIVIAVIDGDLTVKRLEKTKNTIRLMPENPDYSPIEISEAQELTIWGVVTSIIQQLK